MGDARLLASEGRRAARWAGRRRAAGEEAGSPRGGGRPAASPHPGPAGPARPDPLRMNGPAAWLGAPSPVPRGRPSPPGARRVPPGRGGARGAPGPGRSESRSGGERKPGGRPRAPRGRREPGLRVLGQRESALPSAPREVVGDSRGPRAGRGGRWRGLLPGGRRRPGAGLPLSLSERKANFWQPCRRPLRSP